MSTLPSAKDGLPPTRRQSTLQIISIAATLLFGVQLLTWGAFVCALRYIAGQFVVASNKNWFLLLFGTVVPLIPLVLSARWLAQTVLENGFPELSFNDLPDALRILSAVYTASIGFCLLAGVIDVLALATVASSIKNAFARPSSQTAGPLVNAGSLVLVGWLLTSNAIWAVDWTIGHDFEVAANAAERRNLGQPVSLRDTMSDADSSLAAAVAWQVRQPGSMCVGLGPHDAISMLGQKRALVRRAAIFHPGPWSEIYTWPLSQIEVIDCVMRSRV